MATVSVLNADAAISGKTLVNLEDAQTVTGVKTFGANVLFTDNTYDIGASGATRPRDLFLSRNATVGGTLGVTGVTTLTGAVAVGDFRGTAETITATGTVNNQALAATTTILRCNNATLLTISGFASGTAGRILIVQSVGAGQVDLLHQNASSTAANRMINFATSGGTPLAAGTGVAIYYYDGTQSRWVLLSHEQGAWITPAFAAGDYTASTGSWTVDAGDVTTVGYRLSGRTLYVVLNISATDVSATPTSLQRAIPGGFAATRASLGSGAAIDNGGTREGAVWSTTASGTNILVALLDQTAWATTATDNTGVFLTAEFEVN